jgi:hypothetical protein
MPVEKKSDEEAKKREINRINEKSKLCSKKAELETLRGCQTKSGQGHTRLMGDRKSEDRLFIDQ